MAGTGTPSTGSPAVRQPQAPNFVSAEGNLKYVTAKDESPRSEPSRVLLSQLHLVSSIHNSFLGPSSGRQ